MITLDFALETKAVGDTGEFEGYASTFGNVDQGGDVVEPGAFIESMVKAKKDRRFIPMLWQHMREEPIGFWADMAEDPNGLYVRGQLVTENNPTAKKAHSLLKAKALGGMSIGYRVPPGGMEFDDKRRVNRLKNVDLREISLVTMPMNLEARVHAVKAGEVPTVRQIEEILRDAGISRNLSAGIAGKAAPLLRGEPENRGVIVDPQAFLRTILSLNPGK